MFEAAYALDISVSEALDGVRSPLLSELFEWVTPLGDARSIIVLAIAIAIVLWRHRRWNYKVGFFAALFSSLIISYLLKIVIERGRPESALDFFYLTPYSFPSIHAAVSLATYGFLAYMAWKLMQPEAHRVPWVFFLS